MIGHYNFYYVCMYVCMYVSMYVCMVMIKAMLYEETVVLCVQVGTLTNVCDDLSLGLTAVHSACKLYLL